MPTNSSYPSSHYLKRSRSVRVESGLRKTSDGQLFSFLMAGPRICWHGVNSGRDISHSIEYSRLPILLSIKTDKCEKNALFILGYKIATNDCSMYLGVYIDKNLRFTNHINHVVRKLNKFSGIMYRVENEMSANLLKCRENNSTIDWIEKVQHRRFRAIFVQKV